MGPLLHREGWERHYPKVAVLLGAATASYFLLWLHRPGPLLHAVGEYAGFMALIASLFVIAGGIHVTVPKAGGRRGGIRRFWRWERCWRISSERRGRRCC